MRNWPPLILFCVYLLYVAQSHNDHVILFSTLLSEVKVVPHSIITV